MEESNRTDSLAIESESLQVTETAEALKNGQIDRQRMFLNTTINRDMRNFGVKFQHTEEDDSDLLQGLNIEMEGIVRKEGAQAPMQSQHALGNASIPPQRNDSNSGEMMLKRAGNDQQNYQGLGEGSRREMQPTKQSQRNTNRFQRQNSQSPFKPRRQNTQNNNNQETQGPSLIGNAYRSPFFQTQIIIRRMQLIKNFVEKMKLLINYRFHRDLTERHYSILQDNVCLNGNENSNVVRYKKLHAFCQDQLPILSPDSLFCLVWNIFLLIGTLYLIIDIPMKIGFEEYQSNMELRYVIGIALFADILITFNIGIYEQGQIVRSRYQIMLYYLQGKFFLDIFTTLIILCFTAFRDNYYSLFELFFLLRMPQIMTLVNHVDEFFQISRHLSVQFQVLKLLCFVYFIAHVTGCGFHYVGRIQNDSNNWIQHFEFETLPYQQLYVIVIYFSFITMTTIGYGDITPITIPEKIYVLFIIVITCGVFGYSINKIGSIFKEQAQKEAKFKVTKQEIANYMNNRQISKELKIRIFKHLEYVFEQEKEGKQTGDQIVQLIAPHLREELKREFFGKLLKNNDLFKFNFTPKLLENLSLFMRELTLSPGEILYKQGDQDRRLFFVHIGVVEEYQQLSQKQVVFNRKQQQGILGYKEFFTDQKREFTTRSVGISHVVYIEFESFQQVIKMYQLDYQRFCQMRDNTMTNRQCLGQKCGACNKYTHFDLQCPKVKLYVNRDIRIAHDLRQMQKRSDREYRERKITRKQRLHAYALHDDNRQALMDFRQSMLVEYMPNSDQAQEFLLEQNKDFLDEDRQFFLRVPGFKFDQLKQCYVQMDHEDELEPFDEEDEDGSNDDDDNNNDDDTNNNRKTNENTNDDIFQENRRKPEENELQRQPTNERSVISDLQTIEEKDSETKSRAATTKLKAHRVNVVVERTEVRSTQQNTEQQQHGHTPPTRNRGSVDFRLHSQNSDSMEDSNKAKALQTQKIHSKILQTPAISYLPGTANGHKSPKGNHLRRIGSSSGFGELFAEEQHQQHPIPSPNSGGIEKHSSEKKQPLPPVRRTLQQHKTVVHHKQRHSRSATIFFPEGRRSVFEAQTQAYIQRHQNQTVSQNQQLSQGLQIQQLHANLQSQMSAQHTHTHPALARLMTQQEGGMGGGAANFQWQRLRTAEAELARWEFQKHQLFWGDFDRLEEFQNYFPSQNAENILRRVREIYMKRIISLMPKQGPRLQRRLSRRNFVDPEIKNEIAAAVHNSIFPNEPLPDLRKSAAALQAAQGSVLSQQQNVFPSTDSIKSRSAAGKNSLSQLRLKLNPAQTQQQ